MRYFVILEKNLKTEEVFVDSVWDDEGDAIDEMERLIESTNDFGYKMDIVGE